MVFSKKGAKQSGERYNKTQQQISNISYDPTLGVSANLKAEYDTWAWYYQELSTLRLQASQLGGLVRINNANSPFYLKAYHAQIYSFLLHVSSVIIDNIWGKIEGKYNEAGDSINNFFKRRKNISNLKIPDELIIKLDKLYRIALIVAQEAGLGFKVSKSTDMQASIESAIAGV
jgi:hypothetical protein